MIPSASELRDGMLTLRQLAYAPRGLGPLSLALDGGQVVVLCGPSGSGKSSLCGLLTGELEPSSGQVTLDEAEGAASPSSGALRCGYMAADVESQLLGATVAQELQLGRAAATALGQPIPEGVGQVRETLVQRFAAKGESDPHDLSKGEQQLLLLTSLALGSFPLLILDEGLSCLDHAAFVEVCGTLRLLARDGGVLVLIVSHELRALPWADRCLGLREGRLVLDCPASELTWDELTSLRLWPGSLARLGLEGDSPVLRAGSTGVSFTAEGLADPGAGVSHPLLQFGDEEVSLGEGEMLAVAGSSGSGKSRLLATLAGGVGLGGWKRSTAPSLYWTLLPQKAETILWRRTVRAELEASLAEGRRRSKGLEFSLEDLGEIPSDWREKSPRSLSQGQCKLVACLCLLLQQPDLLLLDEPFTGLDADLRAHLESRLRDYLRDGGRVVFTTHQADEMVLYPSSLLVLEKGAPSFHGFAAEYFAGAPDPVLGRPYAQSWGRGG